MKTEINKSAKRAISLVLAFVLLIGTLFTANVGVNIKAGAETDGTDQYKDWTIEYWDGNPLTGFWSPETEGEYAGKYLITTAAQLQFACAAKRDNTVGKSFVIDPTIDAFIMQPKEAVDELGIAAFVELSGGEETREFFETFKEKSGYTPVNWLTLSGNNAVFNGNFDGSGVPIYGIYADAVALNVDNAGFFPATQKKASGCMTIENLVIKNCYFKGYRRVSILSGCAWAIEGNYATVDSCIFANCYLLGQNYKGNGEEATWGTAEIGLLCGGMSNEPVQLSNTLVYGNETEYDTYESFGGKYTSTKDAFKWLFKHNQGSGTNKGSVKNCIILDAVVNTLTEDSPTYCENVYSDTPTAYTTVTNIIDNESVKGAHGRVYMDALDWDDSDSDGLGWWAIKNDYPTPIKPSKDYVSVEAKEFAGKGTPEDPYIIRSAKQLDTMVSKGGIINDVRSYFKVADDVKEIYLNNNVKTKEEAIALYSNNDKTKFNNWNHGTTSFEGHFDGNGVTIYGMISSNRGASGNVGFVSRIGATHTALNVPAVTTSDTTVTIKNVNFVGAYINSSSTAAVLSSSVVGWRETSADGTDYKEGETNDIKPTSYISSVTVRDSSINSAVAAQFASNATSHSGSAGGILAMDNTPDHIVVSNCLYDGGSCELVDTDSSNGNKTAKAGIVSMASGHNELTIENCVAIDEYAIPMVSGVTYANRYNAACQYHFNTVYGKYNSEFDKETFITLANCYAPETDGINFTMLDMPKLNWGGAWDLVEYNGRMIPMPKTSDKTVDSYAQQLVNQNNGNGANQTDYTRTGGYTAGKYGMYDAYLGSGTEEDPYIISNALDLARAIGCGGLDLNVPLYYKLSCDIDVGAGWINTQKVEGKYEYVPFEGHIDGDGHTIYNLYAVGENASLIPQIKGGASIKNLHIRNSNIVVSVGDAPDDKGAFFGQLLSGGTESKVTLEGCSFEVDGVAGGVKWLTGDMAGTKIKNSYAIYNSIPYYYIDYNLPDTNNTKEPTPDYTGDNVDIAVWYKGGKDDCKPQLVNRAKAMSEVDISGYGDNDYDTNDIASLRQRLLNNPDYANVYGDVNRDGKTNLGDLAILNRQLVGTYNMYADGFWRNAALGNIVIYYGENDNYDFARKLELALENEFGKDVKKVVVGNVGIDGITYGNKSGKDKLYVHKNDIYTDGTKYYKFNEDTTTGAITPVLLNPETDAAEIAKYALDGNCQIVVGNIPNTDYATNSITFVDTDTAKARDQYGITYEKTNSAVWLQGGSFTAVEQATLDFINNSNPDSSIVYTTDDAIALDSKKVAITVDGTPYYYAWGDEFDSSKLNKDLWNYDAMQNETNSKSANYYENLEVAFPNDMETLYEMIEDSTDNGKLKIWRGYYANAEDKNASWGYKWLGSQQTGDNKFGGTVELDDNFVTAGKITTNKSMLVKQGYLEMKVNYPEDGHAFPCWWIQGFRGYNNNNVIGGSLFGKVFKLNNIAAYDGGNPSYVYDGKSTVLNSSDPTTYKYQLPNANYEIDIAEFMQCGDNANREYRTANFTFHKFYETGAYAINDNGTPDDKSDDPKAIKFIDWDYVTTGIRNDKNAMNKPHYTLSYTNGYRYQNNKWSSTTLSTPINVSEFFLNSTLKASSGNTYNSYNGEMIGAGDDSDASAFFSNNAGTVDIEGGQEYIFGVKWEVSNNTDVLYTFTVHKANADGSKEGDPVTTVKFTDDFEYKDDKNGGIDTFLAKVSDLESDKDTANQYMYMLIDNTYYTSRLVKGSWFAADYVSVYDDMLTQDDSSNLKKATMEVDYVRVYQKDNRRDIITPDTEEFNNGNHFGY